MYTCISVGAGVVGVVCAIVWLGYVCNFYVWNIMPNLDAGTDCSCNMDVNLRCEQSDLQTC